MHNQMTSASAQINARVEPVDRGEYFEDPLQEALEANGFADVVGGGTKLSELGEILHCDIELDIYNLSEGVPFICECLSELGAPRGSMLRIEIEGELQEIPFGSLEGLAIYINGTDLPDEVYATCDINVVMQELNRLLGNYAQRRGYWHGPTETALYIYGNSTAKIKELIEPFMLEYPLCQKARLEIIA